MHALMSLQVTRHAACASCLLAAGLSFQLSHRPQRGASQNACASKSQQYFFECESCKVEYYGETKSLLDFAEEKYLKKRTITVSSSTATMSHLRAQLRSPEAWVTLTVGYVGCGPTSA